MKALKLIPLMLSCLLLGAHFLRADLTPVVIFVLLLPGLILTGREWAVRLTQLCMVLGAVEWLRTLFVFAGQRQEIHQSWIRLALILTAVALFTGCSALPLASFIKKKK
jgi:hypothetical protein